MATSIYLDDDFVKNVQAHIQGSGRTVPEQVEYWASIGQIAESNPDLTYEFIKEALLARAEITDGKVSKYVRRTN